MLVVKYRRVFYTITTVLVVASIVAIAVFGLNFGIDFTGGTIMDLSYPDGRPAKSDVSGRLTNFNIGNFSLRESGENAFILRTRELSESERQGILEVVTLNEKYPVVQERVSSVGPVIGEELRTKAIIALVVTMIAIILFVAFVFRKVSKPVSSWKYGLVAIVALFHDILIPVGLFATLGYVTGAEVDVLFVMALLAILGYSVNDTIVVFDRVRENLRFNQETNRKEDFELTVGKSLTQTYARSINTSLTTLFGVLTLFFFGPVATQDFALVLIAGVVAGTYSSIFLATPLLVSFGVKGKKKA